jgi:hypothetical protein
MHAAGDRRRSKATSNAVEGDVEAEAVATVER